MENNTTSLINSPFDILKFAGQRLPNLQEAFVSSGSQATIDIFLGRIKLVFGDNPTAGTIFRDVSKVPATVANIYTNNTIGYTDNRYGEGAAYAHLSKILCKSSILLSYSFIPVVRDIEFSNIARMGNYICEVPNRYFSIVDIAKQKVDKNYTDQDKKSFVDFLYYDSKVQYLYQAIGEATVKTTISDQLGESVKHWGYIKGIRAVADAVNNFILMVMGGDKYFSPEADLYAKAAITYVNFGLDYRTPIVLFSTTIVDWLAKFSTEILNTYLLASPTRSCQDASGVAVKYVHNILAENITSPIVDSINLDLTENITVPIGEIEILQGDEL